MSAIHSRPPKILLLGQSGSGKTCAIASLANAGYRCFILDFDNGIEALGDPTILKPEARERVYVKTLVDEVKGLRGSQTAPNAFVNCLSVLDQWIEIDADGKPVPMGNMYSWGPKDVLIIDSLTFMGRAALRWAMMISGHLGKQPSIPDYGAAMDAMEKIIDALTADSVKCVVLINTHLTHIRKGDSESTITYPSALGAKLPERLGRFFNSVLLLESYGVGTTVRRMLRTVSTAMVELKNPAPSKVPPEMGPDLAQYLNYLKEAQQ